jgi:hypothetical protein
MTKNQQIALTCYQDASHFFTPPEGQGQIVLISYGCTADYIYERSYDQSDRTVTVTAYRHPAADDGDWSPWNGRPALGRRIGLIYAGDKSGEREAQRQFKRDIKDFVP